VYTGLKLIHILAVIVWLGASVAFTVMSARLARRQDLAGAALLGEQGEALGKILFMPASIVTLLAGIGMVLASDLSFGDLWITIGFAGIIVSVLGAVPITKLTERIKAAAGEGDVATVGTLQGRLQRVGLIDQAVLLVVVWAMVYKPGG